MSRSARLGRLSCCMRTNTAPWPLLAGIVLSHFAVTLLHGAAHGAAQVATTPAQNWFIALVIVVAPLAALWLARARPELGGWLVASAMAGALVFGIVNHFVIPGVDRVDHVAAQWRPLFAATAFLLVAFELAGTAAGIWYAAVKTESSP